MPSIAVHNLAEFRAALTRQLCAVAFFLALVGEAIAQSSIWKIQSGEHVVYVGGTCHVLRARDFPLPAEFDTAFAAADRIYFETDLARVQSPEAQQLLLAQGRFTDGSGLAQQLSPEAWAAVEEYCARAGVPVASFQTLKPWLLSILVATLELQKLGVTQDGVDVHYFKQAAAAGKPTDELEAFEQHMEFLTSMGAGRESEMVLSTFTELERLPEMVEGLIAAWRAGDLARIDELMLQEMRARFPSIHEQLILKRNEAWWVLLEEMLGSSPVELVLVGVGHLAGPEGLIAEANKRGYSVQRVIASPAD